MVWLLTAVDCNFVCSYKYIFLSIHVPLGFALRDVNVIFLGTNSFPSEFLCVRFHPIDFSSNPFV